MTWSQALLMGAGIWVVIVIARSVWRVRQLRHARPTCPKCGETAETFKEWVNTDGGRDGDTVCTRWKCACGATVDVGNKTREPMLVETDA